MFEEQFVINEEIGRGGMGRVYGGVHIKTQTPVVLKTTLSETEQWSSFEQEARAAARLHHPNIVETYDYGLLEHAYTQPHIQLAAGVPYLIMARLPLPPLSAHLPRLSIPAIERIIDAIFDALAHAHARGVIHRDLKPGNVLADQHGEQVVLIDFGLSSLRHDETRVSGGTPQYMAPEQFTDTLHDGEGPWTDLYALGCMIFEMVCGYPPFLATSRDQLFEQKWASRHQPWPSHVSMSLQQWVAKLMAREPGERFSHVAHAQAAYREIHWTVSDAPAPMTTTSAFASTAWSITQPSISTHLTPNPTPTVEQVTIVVPTAYPETPSPPKPLMDLGVSLFQHREVPLIGRREAQEVLWQQLKQTIDTGHAHAVMVEGFAGLGKTAMLRQLKHHAHSTSGLDTLTLIHQGDLQQTLSGALDHHFDTHNLPDRPAVLAKLRRRLGGRVDADKQARSLLDIMRPGQQQLEDAQILARLIDWLHATPTPMIVMMDNVQRWPQGPEQWHTIINRLTHTPLFFVLARRNEQDTRQFERMTTMELEPLSDDAQAEFIRQWLCFEPEIIHAICQRTGGNPFFAHQVIQDWITRGVLVPSQHGFVLDDRAQAIIPESIQDVLAQRLDHLDDASQHLLMRCALLGHNINTIQWHALTASSTQETIVTLQRQGLIEQTQSGVRFVHNIMQEYIANTVPGGPALRQAHADCARTFDALPFRTASQDVQHHHHLLHSDQYTQMFEVLNAVTATTNHAVAMAQCDKTAAHLQHRGVMTTQHQIRLDCCRVAVHANHIHTQEAFALDAQLRTALADEHASFSAPLVNRLDIMKLLTLVHEHALEQALPLADELLMRQTQLDEKNLRSLYLTVADLHVFQNEGHRALEYLEKARTLSRDIWDEAWVFYGQAMAYDELEQVDDGLLTCHEAQTRFEQVEDTLGIASCELVRGFLHTRQSNHSQAKQAFVQAQQLYESVGDGAQWYALEGMVMCMILLDQFDEASSTLHNLRVRRAQGETFDAQVFAFELACAVVEHQWTDLPNWINALKDEQEPDVSTTLVLKHVQHHLEHCHDPNIRAAFEQCLQWSMSEEEEAS